MKLTATQLEMLKCISEQPRQKNYFYDGGMPAQIVDRALNPLAKAGLIELEGSRYALTEEGRIEFLSHQPTPARTYGNASMKSVYVPPRWVSARPGADNHLSINSL